MLFSSKSRIGSAKTSYRTHSAPAFGSRPPHFSIFLEARTLEESGGTMASDQHRILTTHVGSLVRPPKLIPFLQEIEGGRPYDQSAYDACLRESIAEVVRQQADAG